MQLDVVRAEVAGKGRHVGKAEFLVVGNIRFDNVLVFGEGLGRLGPAGIEGVVQPIVQNLCRFASEQLQKCGKVLVLHAVLLGILRINGLVEVALDRCVFEEDALRRLDGHGRDKTVHIAKVRKGRIGDHFADLCKNAVGDEQLLVGRGELSAVLAMTAAALGIVHPEVEAIGRAVQLLCKDRGVLCVTVQRILVGHAEVEVGDALARFVHALPFGMFFKHRVRHQIAACVHFIFDLDAQRCGAVEQRTVFGRFQLFDQIGEAFVGKLAADGMQTEARNAECGTAVDPGVVKLGGVDQHGAGVGFVHGDNSLLKMRN